MLQDELDVVESELKMSTMKYKKLQVELPKKQFPKVGWLCPTVMKENRQSPLLCQLVYQEIAGYEK